MEIRVVKVEDLEKVAKLAIQMWKDSSLDDLVEGFNDYINNKSGQISLAWDKENAVGFAQCGLRYDYVEGTDSSPVGYLEGIFVEKDYRNQGVAKALLGECQKWAKDKGCIEFASDCEVVNEESLKFHLSMGFKEENRIICFTKKL